MEQDRQTRTLVKRLTIVLDKEQPSGQHEEAGSARFVGSQCSLDKEKLTAGVDATYLA